MSNSKQISLALTALAATSCVLAVSSTADLNAKEASISNLGTGGHVRSILAMGSRSQSNSDEESMMKSYEARCGEAKCGESKCGEAKCGESKCGEAKCGEGRCG